jgi:hypothetical protein
MKNRLFISLILATLISCNAQQAGKSNLSTVPASEVSKLPMRWPSANLPLNVYIGDTMLAEVAGTDDGNGHNLIEQMENQWNLADPARTYFNVSSTLSRPNLNYTDLNDYLDGEIGIYKSTSWFNFIGAGVLAVTSYLGENRGSYVRLTHSDIIMNYRDYSFTNDTSNNLNYDLPSVMLHELGHMIGLKHTESAIIPSVMQPTLGASDVKRNVTAYDISYVTSNYNNISALTASPLALTAGEDDKPTYIHGYIELRTDGNCYHYQNSRLVEVHKHGIEPKTK